MSGRLVGLAQIVLAAVLAAASAAIAGWAEPEAGVAVGEAQNNVTWVLPGGPSWADGVRPGQAVLELRSGVEPESWRLVTSDGQVTYTTSYSSQLERLRNTRALAVVAVTLVLVALLVLARMTAAVAFGAISLLFSAAVIEQSGYQLLWLVAAVAALALPSAWLLIWGPTGRLWRGGLSAVAAFALGLWLLAVVALPSAYAVAGPAREATTGAVDVGVLILLADVRQWRRRLINLDSRRAVDLIVLIAVVALAVLVWLAFAVPVAVVLVIALSAVLFYPGFRRGLAAAVDQLLLAEIRERARVKAVEDERSRIARDLHDAPLQDLAAVIRQLDRKTDNVAEADVLRGVADRLRQVTTELRPPILDDLGLRAALGYLGDRARAEAPAMTVSLTLVPDDPLSDRPPEEVELAVFRILAEAIDNAINHADARHLRLTATVLPTQVDAAVEDDGRGIAADAARAAARAGHLGLVSMAQRAALIGADLAIEGVSPQGTRVRVTWRQQR